jgi:hypothetical protein
MFAREFPSTNDVGGKHAAAEGWIVLVEMRNPDKKHRDFAEKRSTPWG